MTYSSSVAASKQGYARRGQNAVSFVAATRTLGPISNTIILIVLACLIGLLYLTQVTKTNSYGYTINSLQQQQSELKDQKANLEVSRLGCNRSNAWLTVRVLKGWFRLRRLAALTSKQ